jgi:hypothetical protein
MCVIEESRVSRSLSASMYDIGPMIKGVRTLSINPAQRLFTTSLSFEHGEYQMTI